jgi:pimeloyl-ACP methyl ester carboxylesterase
MKIRHRHSKARLNRGCTILFGDSIIDTSIHRASVRQLRGSRPGRLSTGELRASLAAPAEADGFVSSRPLIYDLRLHVRHRVISGTATPCVLLHGLAVSHRYLMPTAGLLGPRSVYVPDLGGFGLSDKPGTALDVGGHADLIAALLDTLGAAPVALLGNSFGCQVAVDVALRRPDLVAALILVGPTTDPAAATARGQLGRLVRDLLHEDPRQAPILAADIRDAGPRRILQTLRYAVNDHIDAKLPALRVPTLLIRGSLDRVAPQSWLDRAAALTPRARTLTIEGAAHNVVTTAGPETAMAVTTFIDSGVEANIS